jgi:hypothetical protein
LEGKCKSKVVPVHTIQAYRRSRGTVPLILNLNTRLRQVVNFTPWTFYTKERMLVHTEEAAGWATKPKKIVYLR